MNVSFSDYVIISNALIDAQLDEGKIWDAIKKKLGGKATDQEIEAEVERLKGMNVKDIEAIRRTKASRDFHARRAQNKIKSAVKPQGTYDQQKRERERAGGAFDRSWDNETAGQRRAGEMAWTMREDQLSEACEFVVSYQEKGSEKIKKTRIKGRDVRDVRRKFGDTFHGMKLITVSPTKKV